MVILTLPHQDVMEIIIQGIQTLGISMILSFKRYDFVVSSNAYVNPVVDSSLILFLTLAENILKAFVQSLKGILPR